jgi:type IV pilus assembly protein PilE
MNGRGVTLIELVVAMAIVASLALIAAPGYRSFLLRSHRVEATAALLDLAAAQERYYLQHDTYAESLTTSPPDGLGLQDVSENGFYDIVIDAADAAGFQATASAKGGQADDMHCAEFTIDETGAKTARNSSDAAVTDCWSR